MICSYCGASYRKNAERCPNCQSENPLMVEKRKNKVRQAIDDRAMEEVRDLPQKKVKKAHTVVVIVLVGLLALLVIGCVLGYTLTKYKAKLEYAAYEHHVEKLEQLIAKEQWEEFEDYYYDNECWGSRYEKYAQLIDARVHGIYNIMYYCDEYHRMLSEGNLEGANRNQYCDRAKKDLEQVFGYYADFCGENQKKVNDRVILGNEKLLKQWEEEITLYLQDSLQMTEEELEIVRECRDNADYEEVIDKYIERDMK